MEPRITLVTGGGGGLGIAVVRALLARGDRVWATVHDPSEEARLRAGISAGASLRPVEADVTDRDRMAEVIEQLRADEGRLDGVCNLVGGFTAASLAETADAQWDRMMTLNARSVFVVSRAVLPLLAASARGRIVNVAAAPALRHGGAGISAYTASKGAVVALTHALAAELGGDGISVNAVAPTTIDTPANREAMPQADRSRWATPAEVASAILWLTSDDARVVTGNVILVGR